MNQPETPSFETLDKAFKVFTPYLHRRAQFIWADHGRFSHYTSAEAALSILSGKSIWMRNAMTMNDFSEIEYGIGKVTQFFGPNNQSQIIRKFWSLVEVATDGEASTLKDTFDLWLPDLRTKTYVTCLSEHQPHEDEFGRLSMWRGYGQATGVCLVLNSQEVADGARHSDVFTYPICYCGGAAAEELFTEAVSGIIEQEDFVRSLDQTTLRWWLLNMLQSFVFTLKHPGFSEESEWRLIHRPSESFSDRLKRDMVSIGGIPQSIYQLPLSTENSDFEGLDLKKFVDRIIIGPSEHPTTIWHAFVECLEELGIEGAGERVHCSDIPLRAR
ncbi:DUF2971 domain-containing protein [Hyphomonas adhaerens]|uniref:DUF2971 domain-containing protein n=1 Tax=Hyphomonas adhaerens TaxID=81029 RepID=UPI000A42A1BE|nr:DUF2971 domain-containing protein [Hyphomonas adhaerens]